MNRSFWISMSWKLMAIACFAGPAAFALDSAIEPFTFFKNSKRRDATSEEKQLVVRLPGCTGFFVKNTAGRSLVATARHCVNMAVTQWCNNRGTFHDPYGNKGYCSRVIAADVNRDIAVVEVVMSFKPSEDQSLELASYVPVQNTRLQMIGYPADLYRNSALTVTENCWIMSSASYPSPHDGGKADLSSRHNCTTYGGNSGGPMIEEKSRIALGMPFTYFPNDYTLYDSGTLSAYMAQMADFVTAHRKELRDAGVVIADHPPKP